MGEGHPRRHYFFIMLFGAALAALGVHIGFEGQALWAAPIALALFFLAYGYDVRLPGSTSRVSVDFAIALPGVIFFQNPLLAGLLAGLGLLLNRAYTQGIRGVRAVNLFDALNTTLSFTLAGQFLLALAGELPPDSPIWFLYLGLGVAVFALLDLMGYLLDRLSVGVLITPAFVGRYLLQMGLWLLLSLPFMTLVVFEILHHNMIQLGLASIPLLVIVWALHLNADMEEKNNSLIQAGKRQEFLQQLTMTNTGSLEKESFLNDLLRGLREFVPWDRELLLVLPALNQEEPVLHSLGDLPPDPHGVKETLVSMLENHALFKPNFASGASVRPLLDSDATSQVIVALATSEMAFGILLAERISGPAFKEEDVRFLEMAFAQIASHVQDEILKKQLLVTNNKLMRQTDYFAQILQISNLLRVHLDIQGILEKVAQGIREGIGFQAVLISLYHEEEGYFERIAQAGDDERWEEIRAVRPPAAEVLALLKEKYLVGRCYLIRHSEDMWTSFAVRPANPRPVVDLDDWHPEDLLIVPLVDKDERLLGIISVDEPTDGKVPSMETLRALEILANQTVHALETAQVHAQITRQAVIDGLTGLYNHGYFQEVLSAKAREHAEAHLPYAVLMMDLDNFKEVNDTYGHLAGDDMLRAVAEVLTASIRKEDVAARYGGEEFAVFLPHRTGEQAMPVAERIRAAVDQIRAVAPGEGAALRVTVSVGLAVYPEQGADHHQVLEQADLALYQAKHQGKNRVCQVS